MSDQDKEYLTKLWHTTAHIFAEGLLQVFPKAKIAIGPPIEEGFHYDFYLDKKFDEENLKEIEKRMKKILKRKDDMTVETVTINEAKKRYSDNKYKQELLNDLENSGEKEVTIYHTGKNFDDLCKGPHIKNTSEIGAFKLTKIASAYWKGNEKNEQLHRVYGIGFKTKEELNDYFEKRKKAEENSNVKLGKELDLFMISESIGKGLPLWNPNGTIIRMELENWLTKEQIKMGYKFVITPSITKSDLFKTSGHLDHYTDSMFPPMKVDNELYYLKPMNCPFHIKYFANELRSYRDLPMRIAEMGRVYRYEQSGELSGLLRVRGFTQDDAHIFCTNEQVGGEFEDVFKLIKYIMKTLKMEDFRIRVGTKDDSDKYIGEEKNWEHATNEIKRVLDKLKIPYTVEIGDAAFYGPKADIVINDAIGREWQIGTIQVDYNLPEKFKINYIAKDGKKYRPVMIHRAPFGSFERFTGILIEHFAGAFPLWLSPKQIAIIPISENCFEYAKQINSELINNEIRSEINCKNETLGYKIREAQTQKTNYIAIIGEKETTTNTITLRDRSGNQEVVKKDDLLKKLEKEIKEKK